MNKVINPDAQTVYYLLHERSAMIDTTRHFASQDEAVEAARSKAQLKSNGTMIVIEGIRVTGPS